MWSNQKAQISREARPSLLPMTKISSQREIRKLKFFMYLINHFDYLCAKNHTNPSFLRIKGLARPKMLKPKSPKFTRCSTYSASELKSQVRASLRKWNFACSSLVVSQLFLLCACQISSKSNYLRRTRAGDEKSGQTKKHKLHEMLDQLCFQAQNLKSNRA